MDWYLKLLRDCVVWLLVGQGGRAGAAVAAFSVVLLAGEASALWVEVTEYADQGTHIQVNVAIGPVGLPDAGANATVRMEVELPNGGGDLGDKTIVVPNAGVIGRVHMSFTPKWTDTTPCIVRVTIKNAAGQQIMNGVDVDCVLGQPGTSLHAGLAGNPSGQTVSDGGAGGGGAGSGSITNVVCDSHTQQISWTDSTPNTAHHTLSINGQSVSTTASSPFPYSGPMLVGQGIFVELAGMESSGSPTGTQFAGTVTVTDSSSGGSGGGGGGGSTISNVVIDSNTGAITWSDSANPLPMMYELTIDSFPEGPVVSGHAITGVVVLNGSTYAVVIQPLDPTMQATGPAFSGNVTAGGGGGGGGGGPAPSVSIANVQLEGGQNPVLTFEATGNGISTFTIDINGLDQIVNAPVELASKEVKFDFQGELLAKESEIPAGVVARAVPFALLSAFGQVGSVVVTVPWPVPITAPSTPNVQITGNTTTGPIAPAPAFNAPVNVPVTTPKPTGSIAWTDPNTKDEITASLTGLDIAIPSGFTFDWVSIEYKRDDGAWTGVSNIAASATAQISTTSAGTYEVRARSSFNSAGVVSNWVTLGTLTKFDGQVPYKSPKLTLSVQQADPDKIYLDFSIDNSVVKPDGWRVAYAETPGPWQYIEVPPADHFGSYVLMGLSPNTEHDVKIQAGWDHNGVMKWGNWSFIQHDVSGGEKWNGTATITVQSEWGASTSVFDYAVVTWKVNSATALPRAWVVAIVEAGQNPTTHRVYESEFSQWHDKTTVWGLDTSTNYVAYLYAKEYSSEVLVDSFAFQTRPMQTAVITNEAMALTSALQSVAGMGFTNHAQLVSIDRKMTLANWHHQERNIAGIRRLLDWQADLDNPADSDDDGIPDMEDADPQNASNDSHKSLAKKNTEELQVEEEADLNSWLDPLIQDMETHQFQETSKRADFSFEIPGHGSVYCTMSTLPLEWEYDGNPMFFSQWADDARILWRKLLALGLSLAFVVGCMRLVVGVLD